MSGEVRGAKEPTGSARRDDLDGLRGLAIALVAVFHVWFGRVSGGVDVFLVLSGYFFGAMVLDRALSHRPLLPMLGRLARRLLPAMVVTLGAAALLTVAFQPQTRWESFADQSLASLGYYQNWYLSGTASDYTRAGEAVSPLQHLWSMSVQGQFYIALLLIAVVLTAVLRPVFGGRLKAALGVVLGALAVASFWYAIVAHGRDQASTYYDSFARAWEPLAGVLAALLLSRLRLPPWLGTAAAVTGVAAIVSCGALIDGARMFPGPWALVPVGATLLVIAYPLRLLAARPLVVLGTLAYSLYLWHWPVLIFWLVHTGKPNAGMLDGLAVLTVSLLLAHLTHRFVENPLRYARLPRGAPRRAPRPRIPVLRPTFALGAAVALLAMALAVSSFSWREHVVLQRAKGHELALLPRRDYPGARALTSGLRVPELPMRPTVLEARDDIPATTRDGCISDFVTAELINCVYGDVEADRTIALAGGSHAEHWITALDMLGVAHGFRVVTYLKMGCPLTTELVPTIALSDNPYPQCHEWNQEAMAKLVADRPDFVFTTTTRPNLDGPGDVVPDSYLGVWDTLDSNGISVLGMRDTPWLVHNGWLTDPADCLARGGNAVSCGVQRSWALSDTNPTVDAAAHHRLLIPLDLSDAVCDARDCRVTEGNVLVYHDSHHLSATYMRTLADELGRQIAAASGWW